MDEFLAEVRARLERLGRTLERWGRAFGRWWREDRPDWLRRMPRLPRRRRRAAPERTYATVFATREDDISSVTGRIDTAADIEVVLVVPHAARWLRDPTVWPHIAAHVRRRGISLGVVSQRGDVRAHARDNGLAAAGSVARLFRPPRHRVVLGDREFFIPRFPWGPLFRGGMLVGLVAVVFVTACYAVPSAEVVIVPRSEELTTSMRVRLNALLDAPDIETGTIPAQRVQPTIITVVSTTTTGTTEVGDQPATVELEFTNNTLEPVTIPAGTVVDTEEGVGFSTDAELEVEPESSATVGASALEPGTNGNVGPETIRISDSLPPGVTVVNFAAASGGTDREVPAVAVEDIDRVREIAEEVLHQVGLRRIEELVEDGLVFEETVTVAIVGEQPLLAVGQAAEAFLMEYTATVSALVLTEADADRFAEQMLLAALPPNTALLPGTADADIVGNPSTEGGTLSVELVARGRVAELFDTTEVSDALVGASPEEARTRLTEMLRLEAAPRITLQPEFLPWRWLPRRADRITVVLSSTEALAAEDGDDEDEAEASGSPTATPTPATAGST